MVVEEMTDLGIARDFSRFTRSRVVVENVVEYFLALIIAAALGRFGHQINQRD